MEAGYPLFEKVVVPVSFVGLVYAMSPCFSTFLVGRFCIDANGLVFVSAKGEEVRGIGLANGIPSIGIDAVIKVGKDQVDVGLGQGEAIAGIFRMEAHATIHMQRIQRVDFGLAVLGEEGSAANDEVDIIKDINAQ